MSVVTFGRSDGTAVKAVHPATKAFALVLANALSYVFFKSHEFKRSECRDYKRVERDGWFVEFALSMAIREQYRASSNTPQ